MAKCEQSQMMCHFCSIALVKVRPYSCNQRQKGTGQAGERGGTIAVIAARKFVNETETARNDFNGEMTWTCRPTRTSMSMLLLLLMAIVMVMVPMMSLGIWRKRVRETVPILTIFLTLFYKLSTYVHTAYIRNI